MVGVPGLPYEVLRHPVTAQDRSTGMELFLECAGVLEAAAGACDDPGDSARIADLAARVRSYLASSRSTTPLGMPHIASTPSRLADEMVVHRTPSSQSSHIRIVPD
jgi:hypothetical protein